MTDAVPYVSRILLYPIKSLDGIPVPQATVLKSGALQHDRELAIFDQSGNFVNGKRHAKIHTIRSQFDLEHRTLSVSVPGNHQSFCLKQEYGSLESWLGEYFGFPVQIQQNLETGFPDDLASPGPTLISTATLETIASWYPGLDVEECRLRFRTNIEISGVPAFWEDQLFSTPSQTVAFQIGAVTLLGVNPCQRCVVVTRNAQTGEVYPNFQKTFVAKRQETFPSWTDRSRFNHFYRLAINTWLSASEAGKMIRVGDPIKIL